MVITEVLPGDCISQILSFTSPKDACRASLVSSAFKQAADSEAVWDRFLPSDCKHIIAQSSSPNLNSFPKKQIYFHLCDHHVLLSNEEMSFGLEKDSARKCYIVGAKRLTITGVEGPMEKNWTSIQESRFPRVANLNNLRWVQVKGCIGTKLLSPKTTYAVLLLFKFGKVKQGFAETYVNLSVYNEATRKSSHRRVILERLLGNPHQQRVDGWMEVELGEFFNENEEDGSVAFRVWNFDGVIRESLLVEGFEFRPKCSS